MEKNDKEHNNSHLLTFKETQKLLKVSEAWLRRAVFMKSIPYHKFGKLLRFKRSTIEQWIDSNES